MLPINIDTNRRVCRKKTLTNFRYTSVLVDIRITLHVKK